MNVYSGYSLKTDETESEYFFAVALTLEKAWVIAENSGICIKGMERLQGAIPVIAASYTPGDNVSFIMDVETIKYFPGERIDPTIKYVSYFVIASTLSLAVETLNFYLAENSLEPESTIVRVEKFTRQLFI